MGRDVNTVLIVGGGLSGLSLASGLADAGFDVEVVELRGKVDGAGVGYWSYGVRAFDMLGLRVAVEAIAYISEDVRLCDGEGAVVTTTINPPMPGADYPPEIILGRPLLAETLKNEAVRRGARYRLGLTIEAMEDRDDGAYVRFTDGSTGRYDLVVAADGAFSMMREMFFDGSIKPEVLGAGCWRTLIPAAEILSKPYVFHGRDNRIYQYPCGGGLIYCGIEQATGEPKRDPDAARARFLEILEDYPPIPQVDYLRRQVAAGAPAAFRPFNWHLIPGDWFKGRMLLIGDAAHSMTPHLSSGAGMAVEDAAVLCAELKAGASLDETLRSFMDRRVARVRRVFVDSRAVFEKGMVLSEWSAESETVTAAIDFLNQQP